MYIFIKTRSYDYMDFNLSMFYNSFSFFSLANLKETHTNKINRRFQLLTKVRESVQIKDENNMMRLTCQPVLPVTGVF